MKLQQEAQEADELVEEDSDNENDLKRKLEDDSDGEEEEEETPEAKKARIEESKVISKHGQTVYRSDVIEN